MSPQPPPQMSLDVDLLRPVLSMPPVILMDGGSSSSSNSRLNIHSVPPSPIVEMPPSPAPSQHPMVEFPCEDDEYEYDEDGYVVEVRNTFQLSFFFFLLLITVVTNTWAKFHSRWGREMLLTPGCMMFFNTFSAQID